MDVMMRLKGAGFSAIANAFREREEKLGGGLPLLDFVEIVLPGLPKAKNAEEKAASISALIDLFEDIDINGDGVMEFDEFTSFCVDAGMVATRNQVSTLKHRYERDTKHTLKTTAAVTPVSNSSAHVSTSNNSILNPVSTEIERLKWSAEFKMFLVVENSARSIKIFTSEGKFVTEVSVASEKQTQSNGGASTSGSNNGGIPVNDVLLVGDGVAFVTPTSVSPPSASSVLVLDAVFIHRFQWLGVSTTDFAIAFYDMNESRKPSNSAGTSRSGKEFALLKNLGLTTTTAQLMLRFCESSALLLASGNDFVVNVWKVIDAETKFLWGRLSGHTDLVLDAVELPPHDLLVTCDLRHTIKLWDLTDGRCRGALLSHERGVRQLCYSKQHDLLLSAGFEFEALAWDLGSRQVALKLSGHRAPLIGVQLALFQTERAITADCQGVFKLWDITRGNTNSSVASTSQAVQLESIDLGMPSVRVESLSFVSMHPYSRDLWIVTSASCTLQHLRSVREQQFDEVPLCAFYHYSANKFVVVAGSICSLWDGETGACCDEFAHVGNLVGTKPAAASQNGSSKKDTNGMSSSNSANSATVPMDSTIAKSSAHSKRNEPGTELLTCAHDAKCRKLVVVSEHGELGVFNSQNFVQMRQCQESFLSTSRAPRRTSAVNKTAPATSTAPSCAVVGLHYCSENKLIIVTDTGTNAIIVIDDNSNQNSSNGIGVLRRLINIPGGIATSAYSFHASMVATVAVDPEGMKISLWDFETLALLDHCCYSQDGKTSSFSMTNNDGSMLSIHTLQFWDEFPVLIAADTRGGVYFFAVTQLLHAHTGKLLHAFPNDHNTKIRRRSRKKSSKTIPEYEDEDDDSDESAAKIAARNILQNTRTLRKNALVYAPVIDPSMDPNAPAKSPMETSSAVTCLKVVFDEESDQYLLFMGDEQGCVSVWDPSVMLRRLSLAKIPEIKCKYLRRGYQPKSMFYRDYLKETTDVDTKVLPNQRDKHRQAVSDGSSSDWRGSMLLGEDMEHMNVRASHMDLKKLSRRRQYSRASRPTTPSSTLRNVSKLSAQQQSKVIPPVHVKEAAVVNAVAAAEFLMTKKSSKRRSVRSLGMKQSTGIPEATSSSSWPGSSCYDDFPRDVVLVRRWKAHLDALTSLEISRHPNILVTCGLDMRVFVWDWEGSCLGKLFDPENLGPWPWRFQKSNATRTKERDTLVNNLMQELERTPAEKIEIRRQELYAEHISRRNVNELRNVNAMLLEHIISKNPEIKMLEQEIKAKNAVEEISPTTKTSKFRESKTGTLRSLELSTTKTDPTTTNTPRQTLRLQSLSQVSPAHHEELAATKVLQKPPSFLESGDLKMDKTYLENELSIACPTTTSAALNRIIRNGDVRQQIKAEYQLAQQTAATRATLTRKAREMYTNMEGVRTRHSTHRPLSADGIDQGGDPLEPSEFLKRHLPSSALAVRPQTAPMRILSNNRSVDRVGLRRQKEAATTQSLHTSASEPALPQSKHSLMEISSKTSSSAGSPAERRKSSLDKFYMQEFHRYHKEKHLRKERDLDSSLPEDVELEDDKPTLRPLHKLHEINDIIDKAQGYCNGSLDQRRQSLVRPGTAPAGSCRSISPLTDCPADENAYHHEGELLRQHLEDTKHRMQDAMNDDKQPHRQNLRRMRQQAHQQQQKRRMHSYLQQKRRELTTNIGNVFKGLQTTQETSESTDEIEESIPAEVSRKTQPRSSTTGLLKAKDPKMLSAKKTFGMYSVQEVMSVIRLFWSIDADSSGKITMEELQQFKSVFDKLGYPNIASVFQTIDSNGDGEVSLRELLATCFQHASKQQLDGMIHLAKVGSVRAFLLGDNEVDKAPSSRVGHLKPEHKRELMAIFRVFDQNGDGGVSMQEIMEALRVDDDDVMAAVMTREHDKGGLRSIGPIVSSGLTREDVEQIYNEFDHDQDATLDFDEFVEVMANLYAHKRKAR